MKLWTGDEWRTLSENEAKHRLDVGDIVLEDDDPRTKVNKRPAKAAPATKPKQAAPSPAAKPEPSDEELDRLTAPSPKTGAESTGGGDRLG